MSSCPATFVWPPWLFEALWITIPRCCNLESLAIHPVCTLLPMLSSDISTTNYFLDLVLMSNTLVPHSMPCSFLRHSLKYAHFKYSQRLTSFGIASPSPGGIDQNRMNTSLVNSCFTFKSQVLLCPYNICESTKSNRCFQQLVSSLIQTVTSYMLIKRSFSR